MSSKDKRKAGGPPAAGQSPAQEVERLLAKGWYKDAIKQAKICHRDRPTPEHHRLLERAYLLRAQELRDGGMPAAAREVAGHLLDFGITDPALREPAAALLLAVGLVGPALELQGRLGAAPEAVGRLARQAADQAVLHPDRASGAPPEALEGARRVRAALEALTAGDDAGALDGLRDVSRTSPFADWRLFARGLAASRRGEDDDARANWDRLDPSRAASRIARALVAATAPGRGDSAPSPKLEGLERWALGEPALGPLREVGELVARGLWPEAVRKLGPARLALRRVDPTLAVRLTQALYPLLLREATGLGFAEGQALIKNFAKAAEPLPIDPRWNRLWALAWEGPQGHPKEAEPFWRRYVDDLESSAAIRPEERPLARALILAHQGERWADLADDLDHDPPAPGPRGAPVVDEEAMEARRTAVARLEESLRLAPSRRETYQSLMDVYEGGKQPDRAAEVARRLLEAIPDDSDALDRLADFHYLRDEPGRALEYTTRARALRPLDPEILQHEYTCRVSLARHHALEGRWDEGRAELSRAAGLLPELGGSTQFAARRACLELKAGRPDAAASVVDEALARTAEPAAFRLAMAIEARRFQLPRAEVDRLQALWTASASGKARGETAGALADLMAAFIAGKITYPGRDEHVAQVVDYLRRTTRIKYAREDDLARACSLAGLVPGHADLFEKLAKRGLKLFPAAPAFPMMLGGAEMEKGPFRADLAETHKYFRAALELAQARQAVDPMAAEMIPRIKRALSAVDDLAGGPMGMRPRPGGPPGSIFDAFRAMMEEEGFDPDDPDGPDDDDDEYWDPAPSPSPTPRPRPKKKKKKR